MSTRAAAVLFGFDHGEVRGIIAAVNERTLHDQCFIRDELVNFIRGVLCINDSLIQAFTERIKIATKVAEKETKKVEREAELKVKKKVLV
ncbi:hypothetical protein DYB28_010215 [Aphanomyces astaci]|uniref:Uncharacterized protein n=1 Tax=Aphanomyces astaci TaxID=112090 RepID=A0A397FDD0_APHAT|nr:hypothetical protein DYB31_011121 [Aphanomyces astaci]RLO12913.1 hypothetical protein DYB28_010215 [Aphanomyces astaci]